MEIKFVGNEHTNKSSRQGTIPIAIVNHISGGSMGSMDNWFRSPTNEVSSAHFGISKKGEIHQYVKIEDCAWAQGIRIPEGLEFATAKIVKDMKINPNRYCVSIEHEGLDGSLTEAQFAASVWLHRYIQKYIKDKFGKTIALDPYNVIGHFQIDPRRKPNCPNKLFPWQRLYEELKKGAAK